MVRSVLALTILVFTASRVVAADVDGKAVYAKHCTNCHGADGHGQTPAGKALR